MLAQDKESLKAQLHTQALHIRERELNLFHDSLSTVGTQVKNGVLFCSVYHCTFTFTFVLFFTDVCVLKQHNKVYNVIVAVIIIVIIFFEKFIF
jgi:high-affinity K+ transport system ATPase subunit B